MVQASALQEPSLQEKQNPLSYLTLTQNPPFFIEDSSGRDELLRQALQAQKSKQLDQAIPLYTQAVLYKDEIFQGFEKLMICYGLQNDFLQAFKWGSLGFQLSTLAGSSPEIVGPFLTFLNNFDHQKKVHLQLEENALKELQATLAMTKSRKDRKTLERQIKIKDKIVKELNPHQRVDVRFQCIVFNDFYTNFSNFRLPFNIPQGPGFIKNEYYLSPQEQEEKTRFLSCFEASLVPPLDWQGITERYNSYVINSPEHKIFLEALEKSNHPEGFSILGAHYFRKADFPKALSWFLRSIEVIRDDAHRGHILSKIATIYDFFHSIPNHDELSFHYSQKAVEVATDPCDLTQCYLRLGRLYMHGQGCEEDLNKASQVLSQAMKHSQKLNDVQKEQLLPLLYTHLGHLSIKKENYALGAKWLEKSLSLGITEDCYLLAKLYFTGLGVERSIEKALDLFKKGAETGSLECKKFLSVYFIINSHTEEDKDQGRRLCQELIEKNYEDAYENQALILIYLDNKIPEGLQAYEDYLEKVTGLQRKSALISLLYLYLKMASAIEPERHQQRVEALKEELVCSYSDNERGLKYYDQALIAYLEKDYEAAYGLLRASHLEGYNDPYDLNKALQNHLKADDNPVSSPREEIETIETPKMNEQEATAQEPFETSHLSQHEEKHQKLKASERKKLKDEAKQAQDQLKREKHKAKINLTMAMNISAQKVEASRKLNFLFLNRDVKEDFETYKKHPAFIKCLEAFKNGERSGKLKSVKHYYQDLHKKGSGMLSRKGKKLDEALQEKVQAILAKRILPFSQRLTDEDRFVFIPIDLSTLLVINIEKHYKGEA